MLVDDNIDFLETASEFLQDAGFEIITTASSAEAALEVLADISPDILISDVSMPGMDGIAFSHEVRKLYPHQHIILLTLMDTPEYRDQARGLGLLGFVAKTRMDVDLIPLLRSLVLNP